MDTFIYAIVAVIVISLISLLGLFALSTREEVLDRILFYLVSLASGAILGAAYFDLIPEAVEMVEIETALIYTAVGFVFFYFLERSIYWYHGHGHMVGGGRVEISESDERTEVKSFTYLNLVGDGVHNLIDGIIIGAGFLISTTVGVVATIAVAFHELPQEIGDFAILIYGGFNKRRALVLNFMTALMAVVGTLMTFIIFSSEQILGLIVGFAGGGFIYLSAAELIPELQKEEKMSRSMIQFVVFILGLLLIWSLVNLFPE